MKKTILLLLLCDLPGSAPFAFPIASRITKVAAASRTTKLSAEDVDDDAEAEAPSSAAAAAAAAVPYGTSYLKELLPTAKKRRLELDKYGRRVYDLTDDGTAKYSKELRGNPVPRPVSDEEYETIKSTKELAADASSADFSQPMKSSADLKALLPTQKMRFMKLDKFGRRIQRMEDDGTVNMKKEPQPKATTISSTANINTEADAMRSDGDNVNPPTAMAVEEPAAAAPLGRSLAEILGSLNMGEKEYHTKNINKDAALGAGRLGADLKELLPKQKMKFMKLDKFGRRVQRMEDDGTVNIAKEPSAAPTNQDEDAPMVDLDQSSQQNAAPAKERVKYGSLRDLAPTTRATWTKLDFKGGSVIDERRTKKNPQVSMDSHSGNTFDRNESSGNLKQLLLPKREIWTKLDFHGASVRDERRTVPKKNWNDQSSAFNEGGYSSLRTLLPERTITWKKNQVLSSGSATAVSDNVRGLREERQKAMREEVVASANEDAADDDDDLPAATDDGLSGETKPYSNLKDLLPEKKFYWRSK